VKKGTITVSQHTNTDLRDYALYTIYNRAIPSLIDGLKPGQRKAIFTATKEAKNKFIKTLALMGYTFPIAKYHHGDSSMVDTIIRLARTFDNNIPLLEGDGTFGTRMVTSAASPRYTDISLSKNFEKFFPDQDILPSHPDPENPEPLFYLPLIPWVLVNGAKGIATGFATDILPRDPSDVADHCCRYLVSGKKPKSIKPTFPDFKGKVVADGDSWVIYGKVTRKSPTKASIVELPIGYDRAGYIKELDKMVDAGTLVNYIDKCSKDGFHFEVTLPRKLKDSDEAELLKKLKLVKRRTENLTLIDETGKLKTFDNVGDLIAQFCDYRLSMYNVRYKSWTKRDKDKMHNLSEKRRFVEAVLDGELDLQGRKNKADIQADMRRLKFSREHQNSLLEMPIYNVTQEYSAKLKAEIYELDKAIEMWQNINHRKQYTEELADL